MAAAAQAPCDRACSRFLSQGGGRLRLGPPLRKRPCLCLVSVACLLACLFWGGTLYLFSFAKTTKNSILDLNVKPSLNVKLHFDY